jgi:nucleoside-diphosphate-sugar epimerase
MKLKSGSTPQWIGNPKSIHTFTYTPDAGKTLAILGNTPSAFNQTWHSLTSKEKITGEEYVKIASEIMNKPYNLQALPSWSVSILGLFIPVLREFKEMMYQFESDYIFDSSKFEKAFNQKATSYKEGIAETLK